jgi:hypothetical protein
MRANLVPPAQAWGCVRIQSASVRLVALTLLLSWGTLHGID